MEKSKRIIFYSWQSDLPNKTNRGFIEQALKNAVKAIRDDGSVQVEPVFDRDTKELYARVQDFAYPESVPFTALSQPVALLYERNQRLNLNSRSLQGKLLYERHSMGGLAKLLPIEQFMEADYFLFLRASLSPETVPQWIEWRAWSTVNMQSPARFLRESVRSESAQQLAHALGLPEVSVLRSRLSERQNALTDIWTYGFRSPWFDPLERFDISTIGSR